MIHPDATTALLVIDVQNDFCSHGRLAVPGGEQVVPVINQLASHFECVVLTQDWHPPGHASFASAHPGRQPFETLTLPYGPQVLWPDHCVQGSEGAALHADLHIDHAQLILRKGWHAGVDSYSAFVEADGTTPTGLAPWLQAHGIRTVVVAGLATDFCVSFTAQDARRAGFDVAVVEDACRAIDLNGSLAAAWAAMTACGVQRIRAADVRRA